MFFLANGDTHIGFLTSILEGGIPLILAVIVTVLGYAVFSLVKHISLLQKEYREKVEELLEKQISAQGPLTETLSKTMEALKNADETIEENTVALIEAQALMRACMENDL